jgi:NAD(P)H-nitrite reductase large subunit
VELDDDVCLCFHVSLRKLINFAKRERPRYSSQMSECLNAGTGCGWCVPTLNEIHRAVLADEPVRVPQAADIYAEQRRKYRADRASSDGPAD